MADKLKIRPLHDRVIIQRLDAETRSPGGIVIPDSAAEKPIRGKVIAVGKGKANEDGKIQPLDVKNPDPAVEHDGEDVPRLHSMAGFQRFLAVDADMACLDQSGRCLPGLHHAGNPQPLVEALAGRPRLTCRQAWP